VKCNYCKKPGRERIPDIYVCNGCWKILQDPKTALPFLRGHLTLELRGSIPEHTLKKQINIFMEHAVKLKRPDPRGFE